MKVRQHLALLLGMLVQVSPIACAPAGECFDEAYYLKTYPDVAAAVADGRMASARFHYEAFGKGEKRLPCSPEKITDPFTPPSGAILLLFAVATILILSKRQRIGVTATSVALALSIAVYAYFDYLTARKVFIFSDIASDTYTTFWPNMTLMARRIWRGEIPLWSFEIGLGQNQFPGWLADPFAAVGMLTGEKLLPYTLGPLQVVKILVAVAFLARYFQLLGYTRTASIAGSLSLGFCGHMVSRGTWYEYGTQVAVLAFYLYALERFVRSGRFVLLSIATCLIGCLGAYYAFHYFILLTLFMLVRVFFLGDGLFTAPRAVFGRWAAASAAGVLLVSIFLLPDLLTTLRSTRVSGEGESMTIQLRTPIFELESSQVVLTAVARQLSPNLLGGANKFTGSGNYLEAPLAYVGLLPLLCFVPCFISCTRRQRIVLAVFAALVIAYHGFPYFRFAIHAFARPGFKISNLWVAVGLGLCGAKALDSIERKSESPRIAVGMSLAAVLAMVAFVALSAPDHDMIADRQRLWFCIAVAFCSAAGLLLVGWRKACAVPLHLVLAALVLELGLTSYQSLNLFRGPVDGRSPRVDAHYDDAAEKVIRRIRAADPSIYRIEREKNSVHMMDALMQDYYGTKLYMTFTSPDYPRFLWDLGILAKRSGSASQIDGIGPRAAVLPLVGVKDYLSAGGAAPAGYAKEFEQDGISVFSNPRAAMGFFYTQAVIRADFEKVGGPVEKQAALLRAAVLEQPPAIVHTLHAEELRSQAAATLSGCTDGERCFLPGKIAEDLLLLQASSVRFTRFEENEVRGLVSAREPGVLFLSIPLDPGWRLVVDGHEREPLRVNIGFLGTELAPGEHEFLLKYRTPGLAPGAILSAAGLLALAAWMLILRPRVSERSRAACTESGP
jgi:uncharacterized membrane protein YfhO